MQGGRAQYAGPLPPHGTAWCRLSEGPGDVVSLRRVMYCSVQRSPLTVSGSRANNQHVHTHTLYVFIAIAHWKSFCEVRLAGVVVKTQIPVVFVSQGRWSVDVGGRGALVVYAANFFSVQFSTTLYHSIMHGFHYSRPVLHCTVFPPLRVQLSLLNTLFVQNW